MRKFIFLQAILFAFIANLTFAQSPTWTQQQYLDWQKTNPVVSNKAVQTNTPKERAEGGPSSIWYFGANAGLDFKTEPPTPLLDGMVNTSEGCAAISDASGNLMFYTDGMTVWTKTHVAMPNGTGLLGNPSTSQSGIIVPDMSNANLFYVFSISAYSSCNVTYSIVDMTLNGGLGDVTTKNTVLLTGTTEMQNVVKSSDGTYWWYITQKESSIYAYKIESTGVNTTPVISTVGMSITSEIGYLKASPQGNKLACSYYFAGKVQIFDFDASTGIVSNAVTLDLASAYGCEFSPDGNILYAAGFQTTLVQYDLANGNAAYTVSTGTGDCALQTAPNGKIYIAVSSAAALNVINDPNVVGAGCNYAASAQDLGGKTSTLGLPTFVAAFAAPPVNTTPSLGPVTATNVQGTTATLNCNVTGDGGDAITARGFFWGLSAEPTTNETAVAGTIGEMTLDITGLSQNTVYYMRAFATNANGTAYSNGTFTTPVIPSGITNVVPASQGNGLFNISYDLLCSEGGLFNISVEVSFDGGSTFTLIPSTYLSGDLTNVSSADGLEIVWNAAANYPETYSNSVIIRVFATPVSKK